MNFTLQFRTLISLISFYLLSMVFLAAQPVQAHEIEPAIVSVTVDQNKLVFDVELSLEAVLAGVDLAKATETGESEREAEYTALRMLTDEGLGSFAQSASNLITDKISLKFNGKDAKVELVGVSVTPQPDPELARLSTIELAADIPADATSFQFGWAKEFGLMVLRRTDKEAGFAGYVEPGELSPPLEIETTETVGNFQAFLRFVPVGFDHILPKGLDHILFVVGLFLFSARLRPLLIQISTFTVAHTITLALASLGVVAVPASIVEPLIAISIAYVAFENVFTKSMHPWRPALIFVFGLLHGLGFASVLAEFGLPGAGFIAALIGFNVGVELGQLTVILGCFLLVGFWFRDKEWYRARLTVPASTIIGIIGLWWAYQRIFL